MNPESVRLIQAKKTFSVVSGLYESTPVLGFESQLRGIIDSLLFIQQFGELPGKCNPHVECESLLENLEFKQHFAVSLVYGPIVDGRNSR